MRRVPCGAYKATERAVTGGCNHLVLHNTILRSFPYDRSTKIYRYRGVRWVPVDARNTRRDTKVKKRLSKYFIRGVNLYRAEGVTIEFLLTVHPTPRC